MTAGRGAFPISHTRDTTGRIAQAEGRLRRKLRRLDTASLGLSEYNQRYLQGKLKGLGRELRVYGTLLRLAVEGAHKAPEEMVLVDYGAGCGVSSLLALEAGIGTVIYNDIYDVSCADVGRLSRAMGFRLEHVVCGDADDVFAYLRLHGVAADAFVSYDVLEHIYDVRDHFGALATGSARPFFVVYGSGANPANRRYVRAVSKMQREAEFEAREKKWGHKERDTLQSFLEVRTEMIRSYAPDLAAETVDRLARATRGLIRSDIERCVDEFCAEGRISYRIDHPTNTCDPHTGNWCEHIMDLPWLEGVVRDAGFSVELIPGRHGPGGWIRDRALNWLRNAGIAVLGRRGLFLAPYYIVCAERR